MGKGAKGINFTLIIVLVLVLVLVGASTIRGTEGSYTKGELISQLEQGEVVGAEIHPNAQVPTGTVYVSLTHSRQRTLYVRMLWRSRSYWRSIILTRL